ncbi:MAG TPA: bifunctional chorismate mutase/prephenate dehydratase [Clostridiales bacterium]|nr:bifunctional chorismate mutase/prephenate dehydratase [Clostridiales bacterium]
MSLEKYRNEIDKIDDEISKLFKRRMEIAKDIAIVKKAENKPIVNVAREKEIINRVAGEMPYELKLYSKQVFNTIFDVSKAYQSNFFNETSKIKEKITKVLENGLERFPIEANVACQGVLGSYSSIATERLFEISNILYFKDFEGVFNAVDKGLSQYGVLPIENSSVGSVNKVYDLMNKYSFYIVKSYKLRVQHSLAAKPGAKLSQIKEIISHEQAIEQCGEFLNNHKDIKITICDNTALAARNVSQLDRDDVACICSSEAAKAYNLKELAKNIQDNDNNYTRFIVISKDFKIFINSNRISIMVNLPHTAGSLNKFLNEFSIRGLNLTKLMSRPQPKSPFDFIFYFDFEANIEDESVVNLISILENQVEQFVFLGYYQEV